MDIAGFLGRYPPFDELPPEHLAQIAGSVMIEFFAAGVTILQQGGEPATALAVIRKGAVELLDDGQLLDLLVEGELFGQFSLLAHGSPTLTVRAQEDTLCYLIPAAEADPVLESHAGLTFVIGSMRRRIASAVDAAVDAPDRRLVPIGELVRRAAVSVPADTAVADAAALMATERVSSLLIPLHEGWAIATDRDLRTKVVAARAGPDVPVGDIATFPAHTLPADTLAGEALLSMFANGVHHYPVTDPAGAVIGVVTDTDLMGLGRHTPFALKSAIERAGSPEEVARIGRSIPEVVTAMVDARADPIDVGRIVALVVDAMTEQLVHLAIAERGDPPCAWAWLALGSAARHEQALRTDQDTALAYDPIEGAPDPDPYFASIAEAVTAGLEAAGIPRCNGDAMAIHPGLRRPLDRFVDMFAEWMDRADQQATVLSSIGYDFRQVAGPLDAEPVLVGAVRRARARPVFVRQLARRSLDLTPPTGFFRDLVVQSKGEHTGHLDIKHGGITIVNNLARVWAVRAGVAPKGTISRLEATAQAGELDASIASELIEAFHFLWDVRLRHQVDQVKAGVPPDDFLDPKELAAFSRSGLKEAFRVITRAQRQLRIEENLQTR